MKGSKTMIKINGKYGAKVGNLTVFTREGAINAYRLFCEVFNKDLSFEASVVQSDAALDMMKLGFTPAEIEDTELEVLAA